MINEATDLVDAILYAYSRGKDDGMSDGYAKGYHAAYDEMAEEEAEGVDVDDPDNMTPGEAWQLGYDDGYGDHAPEYPENDDYMAGHSDGQNELLEKQE